MKKIFGFSLVEIVVALIIISVITAALAPIITKKMKSNSINITGGGGGGSSDITTECSDKFSSSCKLCTSSYCIQCDLDNCASGTYVENKSCSCKACTDIFPNCIECDSKKCTKCKDSNYYIKDGKCANCPSDKICDGVNAYDKSYCDNPPEGYYCDGTNIRKCTDKYSMYCATCNASQCLSCLVKYYLSNGVCKPCSHIACRKCTNGTYCTLCDKYWIYDSVNHTCLKTCSSAIANCAVCSSTTVCTECKGGYYINSSKTCTLCSNSIANCLTCTNSNNCTQCKSGYYVNTSGSCSLCGIANCTKCDTNGNCLNCSQGYYLSEDKKSCIPNDNKFNCSDSNFIRIGNLCVTRKNMGDSTMLPIPSSINIATGQSGDYCYSQYSKCCWKGTTSTACNADNGGYSGCTRTVCNYSAATEICSKFNYAGKTWRLASLDEMDNWTSYSLGLGTNGLMLCDQDVSGTTGISAQCSYTSSECYGAYGNNCFSQRIMGQNGATYNLFTANGQKDYTLMPYYAASVRCVTEMDDDE